MKHLNDIQDDLKSSINRFINYRMHERRLQEIKHSINDIHAECIVSPKTATPYLAVYVSNRLTTSGANKIHQKLVQDVTMSHVQDDVRGIKKVLDSRFSSRSPICPSTHVFFFFLRFKWKAKQIGCTPPSNGSS